MHIVIKSIISVLTNFSESPAAPAISRPEYVRVGMKTYIISHFMYLLILRAVKLKWNVWDKSSPWYVVHKWKCCVLIVSIVRSEWMNEVLHFKISGHLAECLV